ncbi:MAG: hypothetical protein ACFFDW_01875 [Candidatus Thorarchaeota archaeon]
MNTKNIKLTLITILLVAIFAQLSFGSVANIEVQAYKGEDAVILFDIAHQQYFNDSHMQSALDFISDNYEANVYINEDAFTFTNLRGADLIILPAPYYNAVTPYTSTEELAIREYIQDGGAVLYLANPYFYELDMRNYSSNILALNNMMSTPEGDPFGSLNLQQGLTALFNDFDYQYEDQRFIYINNMTFLNDHPIIAGRSDLKHVDEILTYACQISSSSGGQRIINTTHSTYYLEYNTNPLGAIADGSVRNHTILISDETSNSRAISCGSAIMFSDLEIPGANMTWFEAYDNALLWENMIDWLFFITPVEEPITPIPDFIIFVLGILGVFLVLGIFGAIFYTAGKETKRAEVSDTLQKMRERELRKSKVDKEIDEAFYEEEVPKEEVKVKEIVKEEKEEKEVDMKSISDEVKKKPPKARSRSERRRR